MGIWLQVHHRERAKPPGVYQQRCADHVCQAVEGSDEVVAASTRGSRQAAIDAHVATGDPRDLPLALFNGRALGLGGTWGEGQCRLCLIRHAFEVCKMCSQARDADHPKPFWVCCTTKQ